MTTSPSDPRSMFSREAIDQVMTAVRRSIQEGDPDPRDIAAGAAYLGARRASLLGVSPGREALQFALSIFCWWPLKPQPAQNVSRSLANIRAAAFSGVDKTLDFGALDAVVPVSTLTMKPEELYARQQQSVSEFLTIVS